MADTGDQLLREVEEDVQREQWLRLWRAYGRYVVGAVAATIVTVAGYTGYESWREAELADNGHIYWLADRAEAQGDEDGALVHFDSLIRDGAAAYPYLAGLRKARILARRGDRAAALALYDRLADMTEVEARYRRLAELYAVMLLVDEGERGAVMARIEPLLGSVWRPFALEMKGLLELRDGETSAAAETFRTIADDPEAPAMLRGRAAELLSIAGGDA